MRCYVVCACSWLSALVGKIIGVMMMEAARTSETSVNNYFTRQYIPEDKSELPTTSDVVRTQKTKHLQTNHDLQL
jgi:hypothetical protein